MNQNSVLKKYPIWIEILAGAICAVLNSVCSFVAGKLGLPLFLDTVFTVMAAISTIIISFTGGVIATVCFSLFHYEEMKSTGFITYILLRQNVPLLISSFLSRVPINCVDKLISFFAGYGAYWIFEKIYFEKKEK